MPPIINAQQIAKSFGSQTLFRNLSLTVSEGDRIGLIGPNGSGKSTLLAILAGQMEQDEGSLAVRRLARAVRVEQDSHFPAGLAVRGIIEAALAGCGVTGMERDSRLAATLGQAGFTDFEAEAASLSGGWRKRLAIVEALVQEPAVLLLDEPTNHLDLFGIEWLEGVLRAAQFACVIVSHDRYFLENTVTDMAELNRVYPDGMLRVRGNYSEFLERRQQYLATQAKRQESLENKVRNEIDWLHHAARARTRKSKARIEKAHEMIGELGAMNDRLSTGSAQLDFTASERRTKRLAEMEDLHFSIGGKRLFNGLSFAFTAGMRVGLVGPNGSGKTTLLRLLRGEYQPESGELRQAPFLRIVALDQIRELEPGVTLREALAPEGDSVVYQDRQVHVASWAARFLFNAEQLNQPVECLSGGERARVLIARLMLQPADLLLLDEPTNDLDIPTLEILEESLLEYSGALVLVTHDRYMLDRVSNVVLGLDGLGGAARFADYAQWEQWYLEQNRPPETEKKSAPSTPGAPAKKKLSYLEAREYAKIETKIEEAEALLDEKRRALEDPAIASDAAALVRAHEEFEAAQTAVDALIARWSELEEKKG